MSQEAASEADLRGCKLFNPEAAAPLGARAPFPRIPTARAGKGLQLKVREQDKAGKDQLSSNAGGSHGGHMSEAHNSQLASPRPPLRPPRMSCGSQKARALEINTSCLGSDGKAGQSRIESVRHPRVQPGKRAKGKERFGRSRASMFDPLPINCSLQVPVTRQRMVLYLACESVVIE